MRPGHDSCTSRSRPTAGKRSMSRQRTRLPSPFRYGAVVFCRCSCRSHLRRSASTPGPSYIHAANWISVRCRRNSPRWSRRIACPAPESSRYSPRITSSPTESARHYAGCATRVHPEPASEFRESAGDFQMAAARRTSGGSLWLRPNVGGTPDLSLPRRGARRYRPLLAHSDDPLAGVRAPLRGDWRPVDLHSRLAGR